MYSYLVGCNLSVHVVTLDASCQTRTPGSDVGRISPPPNSGRARDWYAGGEPRSPVPPAEIWPIGSCPSPRFPVVKQIRSFKLSHISFPAHIEPQRVTMKQHAHHSENLNSIPCRRLEVQIKTLISCHHAGRSFGIGDRSSARKITKDRKEVLRRQ